MLNQKLEWGVHMDANDAPAPRLENLDPRTITLWRVQAVISGIVVLPVTFGVLWLLGRWERWPGWASVVGASLVVLWVALEIGPLPPFRWRRWRYGISETGIDLLRGGWWEQKYTVVPLARVQHVDSRRGPLEQRFGLATLMIYTAAGGIEITGLAGDVAARVRTRIAALANVREDL